MYELLEVVKREEIVTNDPERVRYLRLHARFYCKTIQADVWALSKACMTAVYYQPVVEN